MARDWGLEAFNDYEYNRSIKAMKMADDFIENFPKMDIDRDLLIGRHEQWVIRIVFDQAADRFAIGGSARPR